MPEPSTFLRETLFLNYNHPDFQTWMAPFQMQAKHEAALNYYLFVRDYFLYDPYHLDLRVEALQASTIIKKRRAWCVEKAIIFAAGLRALGIPTRLGYAIVQNHIGVERLTAILRKPEIVFHGFVDVYMEQEKKWTKATPAFDKRVCQLSGVSPLEWDGTQDSLFQAFSGEDKFMEYLHGYGVFEDVPIQLMHQEMKYHYPHLFDGSTENSRNFSFNYDPNIIEDKK